MKRLLHFLISKMLWRNVLIAAIVFCLILFCVHMWMKVYTRHGQKITLPDFVEMNLEAARDHAKTNDFELIVIDSVHIVGKHGSSILNQNPIAGSQVKEGRKVYLTVTKHAPDMVDIKTLPVLYGKNFERKKKQLKIGYELESQMVAQQYDPGPVGHIMKVIYQGDTIITKRKREKNLLIPKGGTLQFILSKKSGGNVPVPDLKCMTYGAAKFLLASLRLEAGAASADASVDDFETAYIIRQEPEYDIDKKVVMGTVFNLYLSQEKPDNCD